MNSRRKRHKKKKIMTTRQIVMTKERKRKARRLYLKSLLLEGFVLIIFLLGAAKFVLSMILNAFVNTFNDNTLMAWMGAILIMGVLYTAYDFASDFKLRHI